MKADLLGTGFCEYTDEGEAAVVYHAAENAEVRDGVEKKMLSLEEMALEMDVLVEGVENDARKKAAWTQTLQQLGPEEGPEQEALKKVGPTLQVEKAEDHLEYIAFAINKNTYVSDSFGVASILHVTR
jgi:hypothetical protein